MKLPTSLVAVKKISSSAARSSFPADEIEKVAHLIISVEGTINPIILRRTSLESYEVISGDFEYYAAVRAREISPLKGEMIQAIILEPETEQSLLEQVELLRKTAHAQADSGSDHDLDSKFANLEKVFQSQFEELRKDNRALERSIAEIASKVQHSGISEDVIDAIVNRIKAAIPVSPPSRSRNKSSVDELRRNPVDLNLASQAELETVPGIGPQKAIDIIARREHKHFTSVEELTEIKTISKNTIDKYQWRDCLIV